VNSIPYQSYNKSERLGAIVDWSAPERQTERHGFRRGAAAYGDSTTAGGVYAYRHDEDEASFSLVDGNRAGRGSRGAGGGMGSMGRTTFRPRGRGGPFANAGGRGGAGNAGGYGNRGGRGGGFQSRGAGGRRGGFGGGWGRSWNDRQQRTRDASVQIGSDWAVLEEIEFSRLAKLRLEVETEDVETM
jgi:translation initiation factor 3 subunit D